MLKHLAVTLAVSLSLSLPTANAETPKNTLVMAKGIDDLVTLDPAEALNLGDLELISNIYDRIIRFDPNDLKTIVGGVVESWQANPSQKSITFKIRPGQKFHSGNALTAEDVVFSLHRVILVKKTPSAYLSQFGWKPENVASLVKMIDPMTFSVSAPENFSPTLILRALTSQAGAVVDKAVVMKNEVNGDLGHAWLKTNTAGSGAYMLKALRPNELVDLSAYKDYRLGKPKMERIVIRHVPEAASQRLLLEKGDTDIARELTADQVKNLAADKRMTVTAFPQLTSWFIGMNQNDPKLSNPKVREALRLLVDYHGIQNGLLKGQAVVSQSFWPAGFPESLNKNPYKLDVAKAKQLLAEAGHPNGFEVQMHVFNAAPWIDIAQSIQATAAQAGVKISLVQGDQKQVFGIYRARSHQMVLIRGVPDYVEISAAADLFVSNPDNSDKSVARMIAWRNHWENPDLTKLVAEARIEQDESKRNSMFKTVQDRTQQEGPYIFLFQPSVQVGMRANVKGFKMGVINDIIYYHLISK